MSQHYPPAGPFLENDSSTFLASWQEMTVFAQHSGEDGQGRSGALRPARKSGVQAAPDTAWSLKCRGTPSLRYTCTPVTALQRLIRRKAHTRAPGRLSRRVYSSIVAGKSPGTTQMFINNRTDKQIVIHSHNGIPSDSKDTRSIKMDRFHASC